MTDIPKIQCCPDLRSDAINALITMAYTALVRAGQKDRASEMDQRTIDANSYSGVLAIVQEYVEID